MISLSPHHWVSEGSWGRCPAVFCEQVQKRRQVRVISSLFHSHIFFSTFYQANTTITFVEAFKFFGSTPVVTCSRLAVAHPINCWCVAWKLRAVLPFPAGISELSIGSFLLAPAPSPCIWAVSCLLTNWEAVWLRWGSVACILLQRLLYFLQEKIC